MQAAHARVGAGARPAAPCDQASVSFLHRDAQGWAADVSDRAWAIVVTAAIFSGTDPSFCYHDRPSVACGGRRGVAQLVARLLWVQDVVGSNPAAPTKTTLAFPTDVGRRRRHKRWHARRCQWEQWGQAAPAAAPMAAGIFSRPTRAAAMAVRIPRCQTLPGPMAAPILKRPTLASRCDWATRVATVAWDRRRIVRLGCSLPCPGLLSCCVLAPARVDRAQNWCRPGRTSERFPADGTPIERFSA